MLVAWSRLSLSVVADAHFGTAAKYLKGASTDARALIDAVWGTITDGGQHYATYPSQPDYIKSIIVPRNITWNKKYIPDMWGWVAEAAGEPPVGAIMNQFQHGNLGADLFNGTLL